MGLTNQTISCTHKPVNTIAKVNTGFLIAH
jgi:hypothetical protein